jgi:hypothetical protein
MALDVEVRMMAPDTWTERDITAEISRRRQVG